jgi:hypothetical protein
VDFSLHLFSEIRHDCKDGWEATIKHQFINQFHFSKDASHSKFKRISKVNIETDIAIKYLIEAPIHRNRINFAINIK